MLIVIIVAVTYYCIKYLMLANGINNPKNTNVPPLAYKIQVYEDKWRFFYDHQNKLPSRIEHVSFPTFNTYYTTLYYTNVYICVYVHMYTHTHRIHIHKLNIFVLRMFLSLMKMIYSTDYFAACLFHSTLCFLRLFILIYVSSFE